MVDQAVEMDKAGFVETTASPYIFKKPQAEYRLNYLGVLCRQNRALYDSPFLLQFNPQDLPLDPRRMLGAFQRTFLEIGFGHGEVLEELAQRHPDTGFIGIERRPGRVRRALKRLHRIRPNNVLIMRLNLDLIDQPLFTPAAFDDILVNHPDPWPKGRHEHHRFFRPATMDWLTQLLAPGGCVEVASDEARYFFEILRLFEKHPNFTSSMPAPFYTSNPIPGRVVSRFEKMKREAGIPVRILRFNRK
jgi:tRNA (guanine-N7-)-methyltransferase